MLESDYACRSCEQGDGMKKVYYGWYVVAIAIVIYALLVGSIFSSFGVFVLPVSAELNLSRAEMNTAIILITFGDAVLAPVVGRVLDRAPAKAVMIAGAIAYGLSMVTLGLSHSLWLSALVLVLCIPIGYLGAGSLTSTVLIARWFTAQRGRAMVLAGLGMSLGSLIAPPVIGLLVESYGWRTALLIIGVAIGTLLLTLGLIIRERPGPDDVETVREPVSAIHVSDRNQSATSPVKVFVLLKTPQFWSMGLSTALVQGIFTAVTISFVPLCRASGLTTLQATSLLSVTGGAAIAGALFLAAIADRVERIVLLSGLFLMSALLNAVLLSGSGYPALLAAAIMLGVGTGTITHTFYALLADRFGTRSFGTVRGLALFVASGLSMVGARFGGEMFDRNGNYDAMFMTFVAISLAAAVLMFATRFIRRPIAGA
ncbi:MAG: MFS transporter [Rhodospirillaceae bacterium]|nr:MAG: MFS transporter [Rhodospirillaceae bacterium]